MLAVPQAPCWSFCSNWSLWIVNLALNQNKTVSIEGTLSYPERAERLYHVLCPCVIQRLLLHSWWSTSPSLKHKTGAKVWHIFSASSWKGNIFFKKNCSSSPRNSYSSLFLSRIPSPHYTPNVFHFLYFQLGKGKFHYCVIPETRVGAAEGIAQAGEGALVYPVSVISWVWDESRR